MTETLIYTFSYYFHRKPSPIETEAQRLISELNVYCTTRSSYCSCTLKFTAMFGGLKKKNRLTNLSAKTFFEISDLFIDQKWHKAPESESLF